MHTVYGITKNRPESALGLQTVEAVCGNDVFCHKKMNNLLIWVQKLSNDTYALHMNRITI